MRIALLTLAFLMAALFAGRTPLVRACERDAAGSVGSTPPTAGPCTSCPIPHCDMPPCIDFGERPFVRLPQASTAPIGVSGCFAVVKGIGAYFEFGGADPGEPPTFRRRGSRNGITNWLDLGLVTGLTSAPWAKGVQCPDPYYSGGGLRMYYNVVMDDGTNSGFGIARATSSDDGATWTMHPDPVVVPTLTHFPYMPSVVEYNGGWLLAYAWVCRTSIVTIPEIHVLWSTDEVNWARISTIPPADCSAWDGGSANRPRLVVGPDQSTVYMLYTGYRWNPNAQGGCGSPARQCAGMGIAVSWDGGASWTKAAEPIFQPDAGYWDDSYAGKPTLTPEQDGDAVRLYYEGAGSGGAGLGAAEATWADIEAFAAAGRPATEPVEDDLLARGPFDADFSPTLARISSTPNPTTGSTTFRVDLARPISASGSLSIFDVNGRWVAGLWNGSIETLPAQIDWDGLQRDGAPVAAGRYLARLATGDRMLASHWVTVMR